MKENYDLAKWLAGEMSEAELAAFEKSPEFATYAKIKKYSSQLEAPVLDENALYQSIAAGRKSRKEDVKVVPLYRKVFRIAAILIVMLGLGYVAMTAIPTTETATNGATTTFSLPDDSQVVLNAGSEINYKKWQWNDNRKLNLEGEAYFKVAKGQRFEVLTNLGKVTVLGTQFNVRARNNRFDVTCYEGKVRVEYNGVENVIVKGMHIAFADGVAIQISPDVASQPEWLNGKMVFDTENLENIIGEISRQYDIAVELKDVLSNQLFTGVLPMKNLDEALQIIGSTYHLQTKKVDGKIILQPLDAQN